MRMKASGWSGSGCVGGGRKEKGEWPSQSPFSMCSSLLLDRLPDRMEGRSPRLSMGLNVVELVTLLVAKRQHRSNRGRIRPLALWSDAGLLPDP